MPRPENSERNPEADIAAVMSASAQWLEIMSLEYKKVVDVYLDIKSPHAYLAVRPSLQLARDYHVRVNFQPYTLSYAALGVSESVEPDMKRRPASAAADRKARMYYAAARQYARLQSLPFRTPHRLLDSEAANKTFLYAKHQRLEVPFIMRVYVEGWASGWRGYELESIDQLRGTLEDVGASLDGYDEFMVPGGQAETELAASMQQAEAAGFAGVPHYVMDDAESGRQLGLFGREHLALIREKLGNEGLARRDDVRPDFSHAWRG